jgi:hypothetical protein
MLYYQEGHNRTVKKCWSAQTFQILPFRCHCCLVGYIQPGRIVSSGSRTVALLPDWIYPTPSRTYPMYQIYLSPVGFQYHERQAHSNVSDPRSDISDHSDMSSPASGSRTMAGQPGRTYLTGWVCPGFIGFQKCCTPP